MKAALHSLELEFDHLHGSLDCVILKVQSQDPILNPVVHYSEKCLAIVCHKQPINQSRVRMTSTALFKSIGVIKVYLLQGFYKNI